MSQKPDLSKIQELQNHFAEQEATLNEEAATSQEQEPAYSDNLRKILTSRERLREAKGQKITFSKPILRRGEDAILFPRTINLIQGQPGTHKSRLAETFAACLLLMNPFGEDELKLLGFSKDYTREYMVLYVDTERNHSEQYPFALQSIQLKAGYKMEDQPEGFDFISLLDIDREERFTTLREYLEYTRIRNPDKHIFIVLDVFTDCLPDFNNLKDSLGLIDLMNLYINHYDVTFLALIHENPGTVKARGHAGTEAMNKASTGIQIGFEKDSSQNDTDIIRIKFIKCRSTRRLDSIYIKYCQEAKGLVLADEAEIADLINKRKHKAAVEDVVDFLEVYLGDGQPMKNAELLDKLCKDFKASSKTMAERLKAIIEDEMELFNESGQPCLLKKGQEGKEVVYSLHPTSPYNSAS